MRKSYTPDRELVKLVMHFREAALGKPLIIGETGTSASGNQATYLTASSVVLIHERYPQIAGLLYFDAAGSIDDWSLSPAGLVGFGAFARAAAAVP